MGTSTTNLRYFRPGAFLFRDGEKSGSMFLLKKGTVSIRKVKDSGHIELARIYTNEVIGELSFFDRRPRSAAAVALTEVEALEIDFNSLDKIYEKVPDYLKTIMASVAERLRRANDTIRKLQKELVNDGETSKEEFSASDALAALEPITNIANDIPAATEIEGGGEEPPPGSGTEGGG